MRHLRAAAVLLLGLALVLCLPGWASALPTVPSASAHVAPRAVSLTDGRVLVVRGTAPGTTETPEVYDPAAGTWTATTGYAGQSADTVVALTDGRALATYGTGAAVLDPSALTWSAVGGRYPSIEELYALPHGRAVAFTQFSVSVFDGTAWQPDYKRPLYVRVSGVLSDGRLLITAYTADAPWWTMDPDTGVLTPIDPRPAECDGVGAIATGAAELLPGPGRDCLLDPATDTWTVVGSLGAPGNAGTAALPDGQAAAIAQGGVEVWNPVTELWNQVGTVSGTTALAGFPGGVLAVHDDGTADRFATAATPGSSGTSTRKAELLLADDDRPTYAGRNVTLTAHLLARDDGSPLAGETVTLWSRPAGQATWTSADSAVTDEAGAVVFRELPTATTRYTARHLRSDTADVAASRDATVTPKVPGNAVMSRVGTRSGDGSARLDWQPPYDDGGQVVTGYDLAIAPTVGGAAQSAHVGPDVTTYRFTGLSNGQSYTASVTPVTASPTQGGQYAYVIPQAGADDSEPPGPGTSVCGVLPYGTTTWSDPLYSVCDGGVVVPRGATLVISGPTQVRPRQQYAGATLSVRGALRASKADFTVPVMVGSDYVYPVGEKDRGGDAVLTGSTTTAITSFASALLWLRDVSSTGPVKSSVSAFRASGFSVDSTSAGVDLSSDETVWLEGTDVRSTLAPLSVEAPALRFQDVRVHDSGDGPSLASTFDAATLASAEGIRGSGNKVDAVTYNGTLRTAMTWRTVQNSGTDHLLGTLGNLTVAADAALTIPAGAVAAPTDLDVHGTLAIGSGALVTARTDPATHLPCGSSCQPTWSGISAAAGSTVTVDHATVRRAESVSSLGTFTATGSDFDQIRYGLELTGARASLTGGQVRSVSAGAGITVRGGSLEVSGTTVQDTYGAGITAAPRAADYQTPAIPLSAAISGAVVQDTGGTGISLTGTGSIKNTVVRRVRGTAVALNHGSWSLASDITAVTGSGSTLDAIVLNDATSTSDLVWVTPTNGAADHALGYLPIADPGVNENAQAALTMAPGTVLWVPTNAVVKVSGQIVLDQAALVTQSGTRFVASTDPVGIPIDRPHCEYAWTCIPWKAGLLLQQGPAHAVTVIADGATFRAFAIQSAAPTSSNPTVPFRIKISHGVFEQGDPGAPVLSAGDGPGDLSLTATTVRQSWVGVARGCACGATVVTGNVFDRVRGTALAIGQGDGRTQVMGNAFTRNGTAAVVGGVMALDNDVRGNTGADNTDDSIGLVGSLTGTANTWVTPWSSSLSHPLGFRVLTLTVPSGARLTVPARAEVASDGSLYVLPGGEVVATAGNAVLGSRALTIENHGSLRLSHARVVGSISAFADGTATLDHLVVSKGVHLAGAGSSLSFSAVGGGVTEENGAALRDSALIGGALNAYFSSIARVSVSGGQGASVYSASINCLSLVGASSGLDVGTATTITNSELRGNTGFDLSADTATVTTQGVWWGQAGGPRPGQVRNPQNNVDQSPAAAAPACAHPVLAFGPSKPAQLSAASIAGGVRLTWSGGDLGGGKLLRYEVIDQTGTIRQTTGRALTIPAADGVAVAARVRAVTAAGASPWSAAATAQAGGVPPAATCVATARQSLPYGVISAVVSGSSATSYTVTAYPGGAHLTLTAPGRATFRVLAGERRYWFEVVAKNQHGTSRLSTCQEPDASTWTTTPKLAYAYLGTTTPGPGRVTASWHPNPASGSALEYQVAVPGRSFFSVGTATSITVTGLAPGRPVMVWVRARAVTGWSDWTSVGVATPT